MIDIDVYKYIVKNKNYLNRINGHVLVREKGCISTSSLRQLVQSITAALFGIVLSGYVGARKKGHFDYRRDNLIFSDYVGVFQIGLNKYVWQCWVNIGGVYVYTHTKTYNDRKDAALERDIYVRQLELSRGFSKSCFYNHPVALLDKLIAAAKAAEAKEKAKTKK